MSENPEYIDPHETSTEIASEYDTKIRTGEMTPDEVQGELGGLDNTKTGDGLIGSIITRLQGLGHNIEIPRKK